MGRAIFYLFSAHRALARPGASLKGVAKKQSPRDLASNPSARYATTRHTRRCKPGAPRDLTVERAARQRQGAGLRRECKPEPRIHATCESQPNPLPIDNRENALPQGGSNSPLTVRREGRSQLHSRARIAHRVDPSLQFRRCPPRANQPPKPILTRRTGPNPPRGGPDGPSASSAVTEATLTERKTATPAMVTTQGSKSMAEDGKQGGVSSHPLRDGEVHPPRYRPRSEDRGHRTNSVQSVQPPDKPHTGETLAGTLTCIDHTRRPKREEDRCKRPHPREKPSRPQAPQTSKEVVNTLDKE